MNEVKAVNRDHQARETFERSHQSDSVVMTTTGWSTEFPAYRCGPKVAAFWLVLVLGWLTSFQCLLGQDDPWTGTWHNVDQFTRSITKLSFGGDASSRTIHAWGACSPTDCDWGDTAFYPLRDLADPVLARGFAIWEFGFVTIYLSVSVEDHQLRVDTFNLFHDGSGRDYHSFDLFEQTTAARIRFNQLGSLPIGCCAQDIVVTDHLAYVPAASAGFRILDVNDPASPKSVGALLGTQQEPINLAVVGHWAYLVEATRDESDFKWKTGRLDLIEVSDPTQPKIQGGVDLAGGAWCVQVTDTTAYVGCRRYPEGAGPEGIGGWLYTVDVTDPAHPATQGQLELSGDPAALVVRQANAYVAEVKFDTTGNFGGGSFQIVDISNPRQPSPKSEVTFVGVGWGLDVVGSTAYVGESLVGFGGTGRLRIYDVSDPAAPQLLGTYDTSGWASVVKVIGSVAYVANHNGSLELVDISEPAHPRFLALNAVGDYISGLSIVSDKVYVTTGDLGLSIYGVQFPAFTVSQNNGHGVLTITWNEAATGMKLQRSPSLAHPDWQTIAGTEQDNTLLVPAVGDAGFFRLIEP